MSEKSFFDELKRRNVLRAAALYIGASWALAQGLAQLFPAFGVADWVVRWIVVAMAIGFPFFLVLAWFYEFTPGGLKRESEIPADDAVAHRTSKTLDRWIIAVMAVAIVLLLTNQFVLHRDASDGAPPVSAKSVAVLPLINESGDPDEQYFSDGLSEDLITALSQFAGLKVISRNSSFQFRGSKEGAAAIGAKLGVAHLLEGSVRRLGDEVRVRAELVNAADGSTVWSQRYDRPYKDLFALQDDITNAVATALQAKLLVGGAPNAQSERPPSGNLDAYVAYLHGHYFGNEGTEDGLRKAIESFDKAISIDPRYARVYTELSITWTDLAAQFLGGEEMRQAYARARAAADTSLSLAPNQVAAHIARGYLLYTADFDWTGAEAEYRRALQLAPEDGGAMHSLGALLATLGQMDEAVALSRRALATDPLHASWYGWLARFLLPLGQLDEAEKAVRKAIELQPSAAGYRPLLSSIQILKGDSDDALHTAAQERNRFWRTYALALASYAHGDRKAADAALQDLLDNDADNGAFQIAEVYALRKQPEQMFVWLERAWTNRDPGIAGLLYDPFLRAYRDDPRFAAFCVKVGLPVPGITATSPAASAGGG